MARHHAPVHPPIHPPALSSTVGTPAKPKEAQISLVNMAARQRMLSQRMILQTVLAAQGQAGQLMAARKSLDLFTSSQQHLRETGRSLPAEQSQIILRAYEGVDGVGQIIDTFIEQLRTTLNQIERQDRRMGDTLASLVDSTDRVLDALNRATTAFDQVTAAQSQAMMRELTGIVASIQTVAREAKVVSFNAQVMAARAGQHGREFAVVANVLSGITAEIDGLSLKAVSLAGRQGA
ncbi:MAG: methyl-accepting chemotaxis protein [Curvibacter sp.]|nr:MAG: methyl-accepting chemotaxis protein [Curvibacter sp.]